MLKAHAIDGPAAFDAIAADFHRLTADAGVMAAYIRRSLAIKQRFVESDEFDLGVRNVFNYGHSFGHAIEAATDFAVPHGIAVTIGMDMANVVAAGLGIGTREHAARMHPVLAANAGAEARRPVPLDRFLAALGKDKKNVGHRLTLILPDRDGRVQKTVCDNDARFQALCADYFDESQNP
jgi:3-dehydroquinate synthase